MLAHTLLPLPFIILLLALTHVVGAKVLTTNIFEDYTYFWMQPPLPPERVGLGTGGKREIKGFRTVTFHGYRLFILPGTIINAVSIAILSTSLSFITSLALAPTVARCQLHVSNLIDKFHPPPPYST